MQIDKLIVPLAIFGPTASGKTVLAIELAKRLNGVIINADSLQIYAACPTLTARPDAAEMAAADHRLYGFLHETDKINVGHWLTLATREADKVRAQHKLPIFCGGTGFYFKVLEEGLSYIPAISAQTHQEAMARLNDLGLKAFQAEIMALDPTMRGRFESGDRQRLVRAWSVWRETGQVLSTWQAKPKHGGMGALRSFALLPDRQSLYTQIRRRLATMLDQGVLGEVMAVAARAYGRRDDPMRLPLAQALGFRQVLALAEGRLNRNEALTQASRVSRLYAKRQMSWVRNQSSKAIKLPYEAINRQEMKNLCDLIIAYMS